MSTKANRTERLLEDNKLWQEACSLAEYMYGKLSEFPDDERWSSVSKIRSSANDLMFYVGQAVTNMVPVGAEYEWGNASKHLGGLKTIYRFAGRQDFIELDPEIMVRLNQLMEQIQLEVTKAAEKTKASEQHQLELWREQYKLWRKMNEQQYPVLEQKQDKASKAVT